MNSFAELWKTEDYWAIWIGFFLLIFGLVLFSGFSSPPNLEDRVNKINETLDLAASKAPYKTIEYYRAVEEKSKLQARNEPLGKIITGLITKPKSWSSNPLVGFFRSDKNLDCGGPQSLNSPSA